MRLGRTDAKTFFLPSGIFSQFDATKHTCVVGQGRFCTLNRIRSRNCKLGLQGELKAWTDGAKSHATFDHLILPHENAIVNCCPHAVVFVKFIYYSALRCSSLGNCSTSEAPRILEVTSTVAFEGEDAVLNCTVSSFPPSNITWLRNGKELAGPQYSFSSNAFSYSLKITRVQLGDAGNYECNLVNQFGKALANATLEVASMFTAFSEAAVLYCYTHEVRPIESHVVATQYNDFIREKYRQALTPSRMSSLWAVQLIFYISGFGPKSLVFIVVVVVVDCGDPLLESTDCCLS